MKTRVLAAVVLLPLLLIVVLVLPKAFTAILFGLIAAVGAYELLNSTGRVKQPRLIIYAMSMAFLLAIPCSLPYMSLLMKVAVFAFLCLLFAELLIGHTELPFENVVITFFAGAVIPYCLTALVRLHGFSNGRFYILLPFVIAFLSDTCAYFTGLAFGRHKLAPVISPKKTIEGVVGGVIGAVIGVVIYCVILQTGFGFQVNYLYVPVYGILGSLGAVFGDLSFSAVKRQTGIKDYGNLIPGHGGILDRFDSMVVIAPLVELLMLLIPLVVK